MWSGADGWHKGGNSGPNGESLPFGNDVGIPPNTYVAVLSGPPPVNTPGFTFEVKIAPGHDNSGASTLDIGLGALPVLDTDLNPLASGMMEGDSIYLFVYNPTAGGCYQLLGLAKPQLPLEPLTHVIFVDKNTGSAVPDGSIQNPYTTIQAAINSVPTAVNAAQSRNVFNIVISPDTYDEELTVDITGKRIVLSSWGSWNLGEFNAANWLPSGTRRNITITGSSASIDGIRCGFAIATLNSIGQRYSTNQSYWLGARISGAVIMKLSAGGASLEMDLQAEVFGTNGLATGQSFYIDAGNGNAAPILQIYLYNGRYIGTFNGGTNSNFQHAESVRFGALLTTPNYSLIKSCRFDAGGGMAVTNAANAGLFPEGIIDTYFAATSTFTGPAGSLRLNGNTNYWIKTNAIALLGGATKVIQDDITP